MVLPWAPDAVHRFVLAQPTHPKSHSYFAPGMFQKNVSLDFWLQIPARVSLLIG